MACNGDITMKMALQNNTHGKIRRRLVGSSILAFTLLGAFGVAYGQTITSGQPAAASAGTR
jgi:hypothetical protein